jgi:hypothetical protein
VDDKICEEKDHCRQLKAMVYEISREKSSKYPRQISTGKSKIISWNAKTAN